MSAEPVTVEDGTGGPADGSAGGSAKELERIRHLLYGDESRRQSERLDASELKLAGRIDALEKALGELRRELDALGERSVDKSRLGALFADLARQLDGE